MQRSCRSDAPPPSHAHPSPPHKQPNPWGCTAACAPLYLHGMRHTAWRLYQRHHDSRQQMLLRRVVAAANVPCVWITAHVCGWAGGPLRVRSLQRV